MKNFKKSISTRVRELKKILKYGYLFVTSISMIIILLFNNDQYYKPSSKYNQ